MEGPTEYREYETVQAETVQAAQREVSDAQQYVSDLDSLVVHIPTTNRLREILGSNPKRAEDLRGVLTEVGKTYKVIYKAITRFISAGVTPRPIDSEPFVHMAGGILATEIEDGTGNCSLIKVYYYGEPGESGEGGLRHWLQGKLSEEEMNRAD